MLVNIDSPEMDSDIVSSELETPEPANGDTSLGEPVVEELEEKVEVRVSETVLDEFSKLDIVSENFEENALDSFRNAALTADGVTFLFLFLRYQ